LFVSFVTVFSWDTVEPALPGHWCRPLEGGWRKRHEVREDWG
jgi:hypothetical protein